jgi:hypothetical protein
MYGSYPSNPGIIAGKNLQKVIFEKDLRKGEELNLQGKNKPRRAKNTL